MDLIEIFNDKVIVFLLNFHGPILNKNIYSLNRLDLLMINILI